MSIVTGYIVILSFVKIVMINRKNSSKLVVIIAGSLLFLISIFRSIYFASDVVGYVNGYLYLPYRSIGEFWSSFVNYIGKDPFFYLVSKIISIIGVGYRGWLAIIAGLFCFSVSRLILKYSDEVYISFIALISLGYFYFSLTGLRQAIALSMIIFSYKYLRDRKLIPFILLVLFGALFHSTAIIFLIAYPLVYMKVGWKQVLGISAALIIAYFFKGRIFTLLNYSNLGDRYEYYINHGTSLTISGFIIQLSIYLFCIFFKKDILKSDIKNLSLYNLLFLGLVFQAFAVVIAEFFRISMYFSIFGIILISKAMSHIKDKNIRFIIYLSVFTALVSYTFWTGSFTGFTFLWQG